jgi:hypothetical protein
MDAVRKPPDANLNLRKAAEYRGKARASADARVKRALEAVGREYEFRARDAGAAVDSKAGKSSPVGFAQSSRHHH